MLRPTKLFFIFISSFIISLFFLSSPALANETEVQADHVARGFEKVGEKVKLYSKFSRDAKIDFQIYLVQKRFAELKYVVDNNKVNLIEETAARYGAYVGRLSDYMIKKKAKARTEEVTKMYENHSKAIQILQSNFKYDSGWWLAIQHDLNILAEFSSKLRSL
jgi:hypothetical protein